MRSPDGRVSGHETPPLPSSTGRPELVVLTSIRAFAALEVVLVHTLFELGGDWARALPTPILSILSQGQVAVSFFFVLSGFILAYTYCDAGGGLRGSARRFWRARFARIYPLYFLALLLDLPRGLSFFLTTAPSLASGWAKIAISGVAYLALVQSWYPRVTNSWNTPGWSLSAEAFFYALFPALLGATRRWNVWRFVGAAIALWAGPVLVYVAFAPSHQATFELASTQTLWRSLPILRLPEFMLGIAAGRVYVSGTLDRNLKALRSAGVIALVLTLVLLGFDVGVPKILIQNMLEAPLFAVMILAAASGALPGPRWLISRPLVLLGRASYAVYIIHQPFKWLFESLTRLAGVGSPSLALLISYLVLLEIFCIGLFLWIEDPVRRLIVRRSQREPARA
jgi:peptidoglycan/LPS O-acetylase OafA/YrhL